MGITDRSFDGTVADGRARHVPWRGRRRIALAVVAVAAVSAVGAFGFASKGTAAPTVTVVADGLNNPRGLAFQDGHLWVAEAGAGGSECVPTPGGQSDPTCFGLTGSIDRIDGGTVKRVFTGLGSSAGSSGAFASGPNGIATSGDRLYAVLGDSDFTVPQGLSPELTATLFDQAGHLMRGSTGDGDSGLAALSNVGAFDYAWSNQHKSLVPAQFPDANPYGVLADGSHVFVADAASNTLDEVNSHSGSEKILAFVPNPPQSDAVPTCVAEGPDGALYIGQLTGAGNGAGVANVYRWTASGGLTVWQTGFSAITGCGFGKDGSFYVTELDKVGFPPSGPPGGDVIKIAKNGARTTLGTGQLFFPNGFAAGDDGAIYVSNWSVRPGSGPGPHGQVVRIG
jgi:sugar lactone lactonase YvrE